VKAIRAQYVARFPVPQGVPGEPFEEQARQWSIRFAEQVAYAVGSMWGMKRADGGRPVSKDTIALLDDDRLYIWDLLNGTGTGRPTLNDDPDAVDITGQQFVSVTPTNHLGGAVVEPDHGTGVQPPAAVVDLWPLVDVVASLVASNVEQGRQIERLSAIVDAASQTQTANYAAIEGKLDALKPAEPVAQPVQPVAWVGSLFGYRVKLTPEYAKG
jgi:hypothetical protein